MKSLVAVLFPSRWRRWVEPSPEGLPAWRIVWAFPALVAIGVAILVALTINGSSSGQYRASVESGADPALLAGSPERIRSDEWNVAAPLTIAQAEQGFPERNRSLVGGQDAAIPQDLPRADWSVVFRPHLVGFLFLDLDRAAALRWWVPASATLMLAYVLGVTLLPRRPVISALAAIGFICSPFFQWWFQSVTFWPVAWGLAVAVALIWAHRSPSRSARWGTAALAGYLTAVMAMGIYAPYIVPVALVVVGMAIGAILDALHRSGPRSLLHFMPLMAAGFAGAGVTALWLRSKQQVVDSLVATVYPGERLFPAGAGGALSVVRTLSSSFTEALSRRAGFLGLNSSESSTFFLLGAFCLPVVLWIVISRVRRRAAQPLILIAVTVPVIVFAAFIVIPGWDPVAHLLFLDRTTDVRLRIGLGFASFLMMLLVIREVAGETLSRSSRIVALGTAGLFLAGQVAIAGAVVAVKGFGYLGSAAPSWWVWATVCAGAIASVGLRAPMIGVSAFALFGVATSALVNPVYLGIYDMRDTPVAREVARIQESSPGRWVPIGRPFVASLVTEIGARSYAGIQGAPSRTMWRQVDPEGRYQRQWNRLGNISLRNAPGSGEPKVSNPAPDQIRIDFDACSDFAQDNVSYVITDVGASSACLRKISTFALPRGPVDILRVVPASR